MFKPGFAARCRFKSKKVRKPSTGWLHSGGLSAAKTSKATGTPTTSARSPPRSRYKTVQATKGRGASQPVNLAASVSPNARPNSGVQRHARQAGAKAAQANSQHAASTPSSVAKCAWANSRGINSSTATATRLTAHTR